jgi:hypothetical protein
MVNSSRWIASDEPTVANPTAFSLLWAPQRCAIIKAQQLCMPSAQDIRLHQPGSWQYFSARIAVPSLSVYVLTKLFPEISGLTLWCHSPGAFGVRLPGNIQVQLVTQQPRHYIGARSFIGGLEISESFPCWDIALSRASQWRVRFQCGYLPAVLRINPQLMDDVAGSTF